MKNDELINIERRFRPEIEGLRLVAALLVAIYHIWFNRVSGGVDVFFVISGFLITTSIVSTINRTGELKFYPYITKLIKRIVPSLLFIVGIVLLFSFVYVPKSILTKTIKESVASMFFYQNWQLAFSNTDYLDASQMKTPLEHFWALSIQGQFYLIWFIIFAVILRLLIKFKVKNVRQLINVALTIIFLVSLSYSIYLTNVNQPFAYFITFTRVWEFALGSLIAINLSRIKISNILAFFLGWIGLLGLILTGILFEVSELFPGYIALWPMMSALFILLSGTTETRYGVKRVLGSSVMQRLGGISFGLYLWHWVLLSFYKYQISETPTISHGILIILLSLLLSYLMTKYIEYPIRNNSDNKKAFKNLLIMLLINLTLVGVLITLNIQKSAPKVLNEDYPGAMAALGTLDIPQVDFQPSLDAVFDDLPQAHLDKTNQGLKESDLKIGENGELDDYEAVVAVVGSSHSEHWQGAVLEATKNKKIKVINLTRSGTRFSTGYTDDKLKSEWNQYVLDYLSDSEVDLVISQATAADTPGVKIHSQMVEQLRRVKEEFDIDILAIRDNPRYSFNVLEMLETKGEKETIKKMNEEEVQKDEEYWQSVTAKEDDINYLDLTEYFKYENKFRPIIGNVVIYRDNRHMTNTYSKTFGPVFEEEIDRILKERLGKSVSEVK